MLQQPVYWKMNREDFRYLGIFPDCLLLTQPQVQIWSLQHCRCAVVTELFPGGKGNMQVTSPTVGGCIQKNPQTPQKNSQPTEKTPQAGKPKVINSSQLNSASNQDLEQSLSCHSYQNTTLQTSSSFHVHFCRAEKQHKLFHCTVKLVVPFAD